MDKFIRIPVKKKDFKAVHVIPGVNTAIWENMAGGYMSSAKSDSIATFDFDEAKQFVARNL